MIAGMKPEPSATAVIVYDPTDKRIEGDVVHGAELQRVRVEGAVALDSSSEMLAIAGSGYVRRGFGSGVAVDSFKGPQLLCPVLLRIHAGKNALHWAAYVKRTSKREAMHGSLRLTVMPLDSGRAPGLETHAYVPLDSLPEDTDGWLVQGQASVDSDVTMALPLALSGVGKGVTVRWLAIGHRVIG